MQKKTNAKILGITYNPILLFMFQNFNLFLVQGLRFPFSYIPWLYRKKALFARRGGRRERGDGTRRESISDILYEPRKRGVHGRVRASNLSLKFLEESRASAKKTRAKFYYTHKSRPRSWAFGNFESRAWLSFLFLCRLCFLPFSSTLALTFRDGGI